MGSGVSRGPHVTGRFGHAVSPPTSRGVENEIAFWAGINGGGINAAVQFARLRLRRTGGHNFEAGNFCRIAVPFPAHETGDAVAFLHSRALENPMIRLGANPV